eukprot:m.56920 g.56920  ORF g.56920 m.56920 type:complete len:63 (-) comp22311_c1_seq1:235-423(-)
MLAILWCLHCYWYYLFTKILYKLIVPPAPTGDMSNTRQVAKEEYEGSSASEDDDDDHDQKTK